jgi:hypothetical protein
MDWTNAVSTSAAAVVSFLLMTWLVRSAQAEPEIGEEGIVLRYGRGARVLLIASAFVLVGLGIGFAATVLFGDPYDKLRRVSMFAAPIFLLLGIPCWFESRVSLAVDAEGIRGRTALRGQRSVRWDDLATVTWSGAMGWFKLTDRYGECVRVSRLLKGSSAFPFILRERLPEDLIERALKRYQNTMKALG